ncbi:hypothetical protein PIB30_081588 [Stylosanthes scabra]|uniref:GRF-type domain-containing protein n=1 Tax=Stylosanthes scabra TaxID=79078 RepID=A0ABU6QRZ9_9FABA|nr:hypothetical protein [Stylosanthes scabra]
MDPSQGVFSILLSSGSSFPRTQDLNKRRHLCFCSEAVVVVASTIVTRHGRRFVACGMKPKCHFFEWIDDDEDTKSRWKNPKERRVCRRHKFFEWVDGEDGKLNCNQVLVAIRREGTSSGDVCLGGAQPDLSRFEAEISKLEAQERKIERFSVDMERLNVELVQVDTCVGRLCGEFNFV